ncbi:SRPBCC domain-containing protein [Leifsonia sp. 2TAF2]|uniref:SRPBCC family protein n=1 Tax=Leifsonia sp. 2TAF2 TaxID=3233009 RepID=UPI003F99F3E7
MTFVESNKDVDALTLTFVTEYAAPQERVWQLWSDPRQLERWWGPPEWPATFEVFEFEPAGRATYYMTGPDGTKARGWWRFVAIEPPAQLAVDDGFADDDGNPAPGEPVRMTTTLEESDGRTRMTQVSRFASVDQLNEMVAMGMEEGLRLALAQIDDLLSADVAR